MNANLMLPLIATARRQPDRTAVKLDDVRVSYADLDAATARMAGRLRELGVMPGDRVGLMLPNVPEFAVIYYGVLRAGGVVVPMNVLFKRREVAYYLQDSGARLLCAWRGFAEAEAGAADAGAACLLVGPGELDRMTAEAEPIAVPVDRDGADTAVLLYTSGTTGKPKGAELTHASLGRNAEMSRRLFGTDDQSVVLGVLPLFHSFGQTCGLNATIGAGGMLTLVPRFDAGKALAVIAADRVTLFQGVPTMIGALLNYPERDRFDHSTLRLCVSGGASLPVEVLRGFEAAFGCPVLEGYGLSETSPVASFNRADRERKPGSIGIPIEGVEMRVVDPGGAELGPGVVGEIVIRGHNVMKGYWGRPDATAEAISPDGWFRTGDLARVDEDGYFFIVDRKKDMIIRGGFNVYPREVEEVLYQHPCVREAAVIGIPHPELGEEICAAVVATPGTAATPEELREYVKGQLAAYKYPRHVWFVDQLPKTATGKILKRDIELPPELKK
ncbi:MAG TPA: long-chain fatty acid--CoA ligase [Haliangiales bacterium]|nr:long-chain fatty acid--CoA ligase [Haliangiales bacterium]